MQKFSKIVESADLTAKLSNEFKNLKIFLIELLSERELENVQQSLIDLQRGFKNEIPIPLTTQKLIDCWNEHKNEIDILLVQSDWFTQSPSSIGVKSVSIYIVESTKYALLKISEKILEDLNKG